MHCGEQAGAGLVSSAHMGFPISGAVRLCQEVKLQESEELSWE